MIGYRQNQEYDGLRDQLSLLKYGRLSPKTLRRECSRLLEALQPYEGDPEAHGLADETRALLRSAQR